MKARLFDPASKSLGVAILDYNNDGWPDIFVANDTQPNKLYRNLGNGTFAEEGARRRRGLRRGRRGARRHGRGRGRLRRQRARPSAGRQFRQPDARPLPQRRQRPVRGRSAALARRQARRCSASPSASSSSITIWTAGPTSSVANGHIDEEIGRVQPRVRYAMAPLLFHNLGPRPLRRRQRESRPEFARPIVARGAAYADFNGDGELDVLITTNNGPAYLFRNDTNTNGNHWLRVKLEGTKSNRDAIGAVVRVKTAASSQWQTVALGLELCLAERVDADLRPGQGDPTPIASDRVAQRSEGDNPQRTHRQDELDRRRRGRGALSRRPKTVTEPRPQGSGGSLMDYRAAHRAGVTGQRAGRQIEGNPPPHGPPPWRRPPGLRSRHSPETPGQSSEAYGLRIRREISATSAPLRSRLGNVTEPRPQGSGGSIGYVVL